MIVTLDVKEVMQITRQIEQFKKDIVPIISKEAHRAAKFIQKAVKKATPKHIGQDPSFSSLTGKRRHIGLRDGVVLEASTKQKMLFVVKHVHGDKQKTPRQYMILYTVEKGTRPSRWPKKIKAKGKGKYLKFWDRKKKKWAYRKFVWHPGIKPHGMFLIGKKIAKERNEFIVQLFKNEFKKAVRIVR